MKKGCSVFIPDCKLEEVVRSLERKGIYWCADKGEVGIGIINTFRNDFGGKIFIHFGLDGGFYFFDYCCGRQADYNEMIMELKKDEE